MDAASTVVSTWESAGERCDSPHGSVWYRDTGVPVGGDPEAPAVLVLHGFPSSSFDWRHVLPPLSDRHRVVLFDFLGFGLSDKPDRRYSIELQADAAEAVIAAAGLSRVHLVSHDMGDTVGGELLARVLDGSLGLQVERRVLTNGSIYIDMAQLTTGQQLLLSLPDESLDLGDDGTNFRAGLAATFSESYPPADEELAAHWALMSRERGNTLLARTIRYVEDRRANESRYTGAIETHPSPLGIVWGRLDPVAVAPMADRLAEAVPAATLRWLDDVGHWPMIEAPEQFGTHLLELLEA